MLLFAVLGGHEHVVSMLLADARVDPNLPNDYGDTAIILSARYGHGAVAQALLSDARVDPDTVTKGGYTAVILATLYASSDVLQRLLADHRTTRTRPQHRGEVYDEALFNVKYARHARFKGLVRAVVAFRRMRLRRHVRRVPRGGGGGGVIYDF